MGSITYVGDTTPYETRVKGITTHVVELFQHVSDLPVREVGFYLDEDGNHVDFTMFKTHYRTTPDGGIQYSDDGSRYIEPVRDITVEVNWVDNEDSMHTRPESVEVAVLDNNQVIDTLTLTASNQWKHVYHNIPVETYYTVSSGDVVQYDREIVGTYITYSLQKPLEPTVAEQLAEITDMLIEFDERIHALEEG